MKILTCGPEPRKTKYTDEEWAEYGEVLMYSIQNPRARNRVNLCGDCVRPWYACVCGKEANQISGTDVVL